LGLSYLNYFHAGNCSTIANCHHDIEIFVFTDRRLGELKIGAEMKRISYVEKVSLPRILGKGPVE
jgi:hypothetical protein